MCEISYEKNGLKQSDLVKSSGIAKTTISRICRDSNDKGSVYSTKDLATLIPLAVALGLSPEEKEEMFIAAVPELEFLDVFLLNKYTVMECNDILDDNGISPLGSIKEE